MCVRIICVIHVKKGGGVCPHVRPNATSLKKEEMGKRRIPFCGTFHCFISDILFCRLDTAVGP